MNKTILIIFSELILFFSANSTQLKATDPVDLSKIGHIAPKGRVQDKEYNPDLPIVDELIALGEESIPFLLSKIEDQTIINNRVFDFWPIVRVGDVAWFILCDFLTTADWRGSTIHPALGSVFSNYDKEKPVWENWWSLIKKKGRKRIRQNAEKLLALDKFGYYWDEKELCFRPINNKPGEESGNKKNT